ncbi:ecto-ADP-ribosyltransferase 3 isoform X2 [Tenrec ecaudatus]
MKTSHFETLTMLLAAVILIDVFQVNAEILDMAENAFDDEYLKCTDRMEIKYVPQLLSEEKASHQLLATVWENARTKWDAQKTQLLLPESFKDNHGTALMAYISEAQEQTPFYLMFNEAVKMAGQSREDYIYSFQFKAFHFYLTRALQFLRSPCEDSYKTVVYAKSQGASFLFGGLNQARFGHFTLAYSAKPQAINEQDSLLIINTCFGVSIEKFLDKESKRTVLIPLNEVFQVSPEENSNSLFLRSTNKTCSHYECAFLGGLKSNNCVENIVSFQPVYVRSPDERTQELADPVSFPGTESHEPAVIPDVNKHEPTQMPGMKMPELFSLPARDTLPVPVPGPQTHPSASSVQTLLPPLGTLIILTCASATHLFVAL